MENSKKRKGRNEDKEGIRLCPSTREMSPKGLKVEVSNDEEGFDDAWFVATILKPPPSSPSSGSQTIKGKAKIQYESLLSKADPSKHLIEFVDVSFIQPLPPPDDVSFEPHDVVDAFHNGGWWKGVVSEVFEGEQVKEVKCYNVVFEKPPHAIKFGPSNLRLHLDWVDGSWVKPPKMMRMQGLYFCKGMPVEVYLVKKNSKEGWFPAIIVDEVGFNSFKVICESTKVKKGVMNMTVDCFHIRSCSPPDLVVESAGLLDKTGALLGPDLIIQRKLASFCRGAWVTSDDKEKWENAEKNAKFC